MVTKSICHFDQAAKLSCWKADGLGKFSGQKGNRSSYGCSKLGIMRVRLNLGDTVYVSDEDDHGIIEQFVPYGRVIVRLVKKGKVLKLNRGDVKKSRQ